MKNANLTSDNFPMVLLGKCLTEKEYEKVFDGHPLIKGKSIVINASGKLFLYMADDHRKDTPEQIIVKEIGGYEMHFLPVKCKESIRLTDYKYV